MQIYICKNENFIKAFEVLSVTVNGTLYQKSNIFYVKNKRNNDPVFGEIKAILKNSENKIFIEYTKFITIGFNNHNKSYEIVRALNVINKRLHQLDVENFVRPIKAHKTASGLLVVSRRDI